MWVGRAVGCPGCVACEVGMVVDVGNTMGAGEGLSHAPTANVMMRASAPSDKALCPGFIFFSVSFLYRSKLFPQPSRQSLYPLLTIIPIGLTQSRGRGEKMVKLGHEHEDQQTRLLPVSVEQSDQQHPYAFGGSSA